MGRSFLLPGRIEAERSRVVSWHYRLLVIHAPQAASRVSSVPARPAPGACGGRITGRTIGGLSIIAEALIFRGRMRRTVRRRIG